MPPVRTCIITPNPCFAADLETLRLKSVTLPVVIIIPAEEDIKVLAVTISFAAILAANDALATLNDPLIPVFNANELVEALATTPDDKA